MPNLNIASTRSKAFAACQVSFEAPRPSIQEVAIVALEERALQQLDRGMDLESVLQILASHPIGRFCID